LKEHEQQTTKRTYELDMEGKQLLKQKTDLDNEMKQLDLQHGQTSEHHYDNTMFLMKDSKMEEERKRRHEKQQELNKDLVQKKVAEKDQLNKELADLHDRYMGMVDL